MRGFGTIKLNPAMFLKPFIETVNRIVVYKIYYSVELISNK